MTTATLERTMTIKTTSIRTVLIGNTVTPQSLLPAIRKGRTQKMGIEALRAKAYITVTNPNATLPQLGRALRSYWDAVDIIAKENQYAVREVVGGSHEWLYTLSAVAVHRRAGRSVIESLLTTLEHPDFVYIENFANNGGFTEETDFIVEAILNNPKASDSQLERAERLLSSRIN